MKQILLLTTLIILLFQTKGQAQTITPGESYFISASNGLNYRDKPDGEVLNVFYVNTEVKVLVNTGDSLEVVDKGKTINGEWVGVEHNQDTVYIFSGYLSDTYVDHQVRLYELLSYGENKNYDKSWVILSEPYSYEANVIPGYKLGEDPIHLGPIRAERFYKSVGIHPESSVYIYSLKLDSVIELSIKDYPLKAMVSMYEKGSKYLSARSYQIGLDLGKDFTHLGRCYVSVGKRNPFQTGRLNRMPWKKVESKVLPHLPSKGLIANHRLGGSLKPYGDVHFFSRQHLDYYMQSIESNVKSLRYFLVVNKKTNEIVFEQFQMNTEGSYLNPLDASELFVGELFKNKPIMFTNFTGSSFGCPGFHFFDKKQSSIWIQCDNRH